MTEADENFLCERNDEIDNAAWQLILAVRDNPEYNPVNLRKCSWYNSFIEFFHVISKNDACPNDVVCINIIGYIEGFIASAGLPPNMDADAWDMYIIGSVIEHAENLLLRKRISFCHPWIDADEEICYKTCDKCTHCKR